MVDIAYRDYEVRDLIGLEAEGVNIEPVRKLFRENRIVSSMAGDFDHKSTWELLTDPDLGARYFNSEERSVFRRYRLDPRFNDQFDQLARRQHGRPARIHARGTGDSRGLPNRSYGGDRVLLGHLPEQSRLGSKRSGRFALDPEPWVVQRLAAIPVSEFPVVTAEGTARVEPFYIVMGFAPTKYGLAIIGRASQKQVVNVAQRGGMCTVLIGRPAGRLIGPGGTM